MIHIRCLLIPFLLAAMSTWADIAHFEIEPNNKPGEFNPISGAVTVYGSMVGSDQDGFIWTVSDEDARKRWTFELHGIPGALTVMQIVRLEYAENGVDVVGKTTLMKMGTRDGSRPSIHEGLVFEPGEYVLGMASAGSKSGKGAGAFRPPVGGLSFGEEPEASGTASDTADSENQAGSYRLLIYEQSMSVRKYPGPRTSKENAYAIRPGGEFATYETEQSAWYSFKFSEQDANSRWDIRVQAPVGKKLRGVLYAEDGQKLLESSVDKKGRLRFPSLAPPPGTWFLELSTKQPGFVHYVGSEETGVRVAGQEAEPNNSSKFANEVDFSQPLTGRIGDDDKEDYFLFSVDEADTEQLHTLRIESPTPGKLTFCLRSSDWRNVQCRTGTPPLQMPDLLLPTGDWGIHLHRADAQDYTISYTPQGPIEPGREVEPNDELKFASGVPANMRIKGRFDGDDTDVFQFIIDGEAQLWRFQVNGAGVNHMTLLNSRGKERAKAGGIRGQKRLVLDNLFLLPGRHMIRLSGSGTDGYTLLARALGQPASNPPTADTESPGAEAADATIREQSEHAISSIWNPDGEIEPNDKYNRQRIAIGQVRTGTLPDASDQDHYRFFVANHDHLKITIEPPPDGSIRPYINWYGLQIGAADKRKVGEVITWEGVLAPGDYTILLLTDQPSDEPYRLKLERLPRFSCPKDCEPNGMHNLHAAAPFPTDHLIQGVVGDWRDMDVYQLPAFEEDTEILIRSAKALSKLMLYDHQGTFLETQRFDSELGAYSLTVPAGEAHELHFRGSRDEYELQVEFPGGQFKPVQRELKTTVNLKLEHAEVAAFLDEGQRVDGEMTVKNNDPQALQLSLSAVTSDHRWSVNLARQETNIAPGEQITIPVSVVVPSDAWADHAVRISVLARSPNGQQAESWSDVQVGRSVIPVDPFLHWPIPESLRGGFNAAWLPFGAEWADDTPEDARDEVLRDNLVFPGTSAYCCRRDPAWENAGGPSWTLDLPGDTPIPVAGVAIDHFGKDSVLTKIRAATLLVSDDGVNFREVLSFKTLPVNTEQQFAMDAPVLARYARLRIEGTFQRPAKDVLAGEWKVILQPGFDLSDGSGFNIAAPEFGGHVAWTWPPDSNTASVLNDEDKPAWAILGKGSVVEYIIGFHRDRAAQVSRIDWEYHDSSNETDRNFERVEVYASTGSPTGPWQSLGVLNLKEKTSTERLELVDPQWARFVRLRAHLAPDAKRSKEPGIIRIWERPSGDAYTSVLTEWGEAGSRAFFELQAGVPESTTLASGNDSREKAAPLTLGQRANGAVALGSLEHWYRVSVPDGINTLRFELTGDPTVRTVPVLSDGDENEIPVIQNHAGRSPNRHRYEAFVEPGTDAWLKISEPPRNVVFSWDTSGSVSAYLPRINNAVVAFSGEVQPGLEWVNLLPFNNPFLLDKWSDSPLVLQSVMNDFRQTSDSSAAEFTLFKASKALGPRAGTKAVVIVTDAVTPYFGKLWQPMAEIQPRIFGIGVAGSGVAEQNRFRDWAAVNGGDYRQLRYLGEMDVAFDRASTKMHRPAAYTLLAEGEYQKAPGPGQLLVRAGESQPQAAVELILDASGSMLQRIEGKRRINVAKEVLTEAVREHIPAGTLVALRVFGHKEVDSCRTDLEIPLAPLNPNKAAEKIAGIQAMNLARTPIADSLAEVEGDLKGAKSGAVVLVTDGEETCDGDPAAVIEALQEKGFDISLNIVGFAIDDANLAAQFESWAELGNGRYFSAENQDGLSEAIESALRVPFTVYDRDGNEVGTGQVGGIPLDLEQGVYNIVVRTRTPERFDNVVIQGGGQVVLELK